MKSTGAVVSTTYRSYARGEGLERAFTDFAQMGDAGLQQLRADFEAERKALVAELAQVQKLRADSEAERKALVAELAQAQRKMQLHERVLYHPRLHPGQRQTCLHVMSLLESAQAKGEGLPIRINIQDAAKITGQSRETVGKHILELADLGVFARREEKKANYVAKRPNSYIYVSPGPLYHRLDEIGGQRTWGGLRERKIRQVEDTSTSAVCATQDLLPLDAKSQLSRETAIRPEAPQGHEITASDDHESIPVASTGPTVEKGGRNMQTLPGGSAKEHVRHDVGPLNNRQEGERGIERVRLLGREVRRRRSGELPRSAGEGGVEDVVQHAVSRLLAIAGDADAHIVLQPGGTHKYLRKPTALSADLVEKHLRGDACVGAFCGRRDGTTHALVWDADDREAATVLMQAAGKLVKAGAYVLLSRSPSDHHPHGMHLSLLFEEPVEIDRAFRVAQHHAPGLASIAEYWPRRKAASATTASDCPWGQAVRLPGGRYRRGQVDALVQVRKADSTTWHEGPGVAQVLCQPWTPRDWVQTQVSSEDRTPAPEPSSSARILQLPPRSTHRSTGDTRPHKSRPVNGAQGVARDPIWLERYGSTKNTMYLWFSDHDAADWFNRTHSCASLLPVEAGTGGYARAVWRGERTPSVHYGPGNLWVDFGAGGYRDGRRDGGDALDLYCRLHSLNRSAALRHAARQLIAEALRQLRQSASGSYPLPAWITRLLSPTGTQYYKRLCDQAMRQPTCA